MATTACILVPGLNSDPDTHRYFSCMPSLQKRIRSAVLIPLISSAMACAQYTDEALIYVGAAPAISLTHSPSTTLTSTTTCRLLLDVMVDPFGNIVSVSAVKHKSTCTDSTLIASAKACARSLGFAAMSGPGPTQQSVGVLWEFGAQDRGGLFRDIVGDLPKDGVVCLERPRANSFDGVTLDEFIKANIQPRPLKDPYVGASVALDLEVDAEGRISDVRVGPKQRYEGGPDSAQCAEAVRICRLLPPWTPGRVNGKEVPMRASFSIPFSTKVPHPTHVEFVTGKERMIHRRPRFEVVINMRCVMSYLLTVDRNGAVLKADDDRKRCTCLPPGPDLDPESRVNEYRNTALQFRFAPDPRAPAEQIVRVWWDLRTPVELEASSNARPPVPGAAASSSQSTQRDDDRVFDPIAVQEQPQFPDGHIGILRYFQGAVQYPSDAREERIQGTVFVDLTVKADGTVADVMVKRGVHPSLDREAERVVKAMPAWNPGKLNGKAVSVRLTKAVCFGLD